MKYASILKPQNYNEAANIISVLANEYSVIIDTSDVDEETADKIISFVSGAAYARDGQMTKLNGHLYRFSISPFEK